MNTDNNTDVSHGIKISDADETMKKMKLFLDHLLATTDEEEKKTEPDALLGQQNKADPPADSAYSVNA